MTPNQRIFADEYLRDRNATRAYMVAYPRIKNPDVAAVNASRTLRIAKVSTYIQRTLEEMSSAAVADAREIMEYYTAVMRGEVVERVPLFVGDGVQQLHDNMPKISDRTAAADKLAKLLGVDKPVGVVDDAPRIIEVRPDA